MHGRYLELDPKYTVTLIKLNLIRMSLKKFSGATGLALYSDFASVWQLSLKHWQISYFKKNNVIFQHVTICIIFNFSLCCRSSLTAAPTTPRRARKRPGNERRREKERQRREVWASRSKNGPSVHQAAAGTACSAANTLVAATRGD
jgi:hypothetical protein